MAVHRSDYTAMRTILCLEADDMAEVYAFCLENAENAPYYLYMTLATTCKGITGSRRDAYFASVSAAPEVLSEAN